MFVEENPYLLPLPIEPFGYYRYGDRIVRLDGCVEVDGAYYHAPPGWIGRTVSAQWDGSRVRLLDRATGNCFASTSSPGERKLYVEPVSTVPLLVIDDLGMRKLPATAAEACSTSS
jgi:hypothetical protein